MTDTTPSPPRIHQDPPRLLVWVALAICLASAAMVLAGAWRVGIWTDEPAHVMRYDNLQDHGWYLLDDDFDGEEPGAWVTDRYVYGPVTTQLMHGVNRVLGLDPAGGLGTSVRAYSVRHLVVGVLGLLGAVAVVMLGRRLLRSWRWGAVAAGTLAAIPMWPGLSMFDIKDIPAATGYTLVTLGLVELLTAAGRRALPVVALSAGLVLAVGTRPGLWPGLAFGIGLALLLPLARGGEDRRTWLRSVVAPLVIAGTIAYAVLLVSYPSFYARPDRWLLGAIGDSSDYTGSATGTMSGSWGYLPLRVVVTMPPLLLVVGMAGCFFLLAGRALRGQREVVGWLVVAAQALLLPTLAVLRQSALYDDLRQVVFAVPAVALLLTLGWRQVADDLGRSSRLVRRGAALAWSAALVVPVAVQWQMFPYGYSYVAPEAEAFATEHDWGRLSLRELVPKIPPGEFVVCHPFLSDRDVTMRYSPTTGRPSAELGNDCRTDPLGTLAPYDLVEVDDPARAVVDDTFLAVFARGREPGKNCESLATVERGRYLGSVVLSRVARCVLVPDDYPGTSVDFTSDGAGARYLLGGWTSSPAEEGVRLSEPYGSVGFTIPDDLVAPLHIDLVGEAAEEPGIRVNNEPVPATVTADGWTVDVPAETVEALGGQRLVVTLTRGDDEPVVLHQITLERA